MSASRREFLRRSGHWAIGGLSAPFLAGRARADGVLSATDFGLVADAGEDGSGTDNRKPLLDFLNRLAKGDVREATIPAGRYRVSAPVAAGSHLLRDLALYAEGAELVFTSPEPRRNRGYLVLSNTLRRGGRLKIEGLSARLNRPAVRIANSDLIRLDGFNRYSVTGLRIGSADNMALTIGRRDARFRFVPEEVRVSECRIGGWRERDPHLYASVGDTGIWIISPAVETTVTDCDVRETGDDGIYVGHSATRTIQRVVIRNNTLRDSGARAIGVGVPQCEIVDNSVDRTNCPAIICEWMDGGDASNTLIRGNWIRNAGQLEAGQVGRRIIGKVQPCGVFIYQPGGGIRMEGNVIEGAREGAVHIHAHQEGNFDGLEIVGDRYDRLWTDKDGRPREDGRRAVFQRSGEAATAVRGFSARDVAISRTEARLFWWQSSGTEPDGEVVAERIRYQDCGSLPPRIDMRARGPSSGLPSFRVTWMARDCDDDAPQTNEPGIDIRRLAWNQP